MNGQYLDKRREIPLEFRELARLMAVRGICHLKNVIAKLRAQKSYGYRQTLLLSFT